MIATMNTPAHILIIDDDDRIRELLFRYLTEQGFEVKAVANGREMSQAIERARFDLWILDLMLPGEDGLSILRRTRGTGETTPVILLTAKGDEIDRIVGLEMGADDYLAKPFSPRELVARIHAVLRRQGMVQPGAPVESAGEVIFGQCRLDLGSRTLFRDEVATQLTTGEFSLLKVLVNHPRQALSRDRLMELARGRDHEAFDRTIDVQISRLRKLIEPDSAKPRYIQTVWGHGYTFVPDGTTA
ncbi:two-component system OmpR family response regulator/two-component system phosphate regulon response regulator OmpR [Sulfurirhabdus autotrophica]|uniref:Two-component system OmpR family response regulator/two-component system phosphate regulon response regulator OmpR n=2 Tax=Sulfurirhabdus autotrophica TaxID=1706046 RepID=A0A4R3XUC2_9PROT|nr:two-component system OmpR family response regulator/two-component system phosphate regulon response regulator OmpR [Sulfurirhabdus autotrophica]